MRKQVKGSPFVLSSFELSESPYLEDYKFGEAISNKKHSSGHALRVNTKLALKASIGEHLERLASVISYKGSTNNPTMSGFNLLNGKTIEIGAEKIYLDFDLPMFKQIENRQYLFNDSSGLASHINSINAINSGFEEFIERQSLIYNWLSKSAGEKVDYIGIKDYGYIDQKGNLKKLISITEKISDQFYSYNISILDGIFVILTIGYNGSVFSAGLGTSTDFFEALRSSLCEYIMILDSGFSAHYNEGFNEDFENVYINNFYSMSINEFLESYSYLLCSKIKFDLSNCNKQRKINELILDLKRKIGIDVYAVYLPFPLDSIHVKVVKVVSLDAYPHLHTELYDPLDFKISNSLPKSSFPNKHKFIPFA